MCYRAQPAWILARGRVQLTPVLGTAFDLAADGDRRMVLLADGRAVRAATVVLAQGVIHARRSPATTALATAAAEHGLTYVEPGMPTEPPWIAVPAGQDVLVAGLGPTFRALLTDPWVISGPVGRVGGRRG